MESFADELRTAMAEAGGSAADLAARSGLTEGAISYLRSGQRAPSFKSIRALSAVLPRLVARLDTQRRMMDSIESAIADIKAGKMIVVLDDEDRENEGDLVMAAEKATPAAINFMRKEAGGLICVPMTGERLDALQIPAMVVETDVRWSATACMAATSNGGDQARIRMPATAVTTARTRKIAPTRSANRNRADRSGIDAVARACDHTETVRHDLEGPGDLAADFAVESDVHRLVR